MAGFLRKYNTAATIYIPIVKRGVVDFAVSADWTPAAGDVKVSKDGGAAANIGTLPSAVAMGNTAYWKFTLTSTEVSAKVIVVTVADASTKAVEDQAFVVETYGNASAQHAFDLSAATQAVNVTQFGGAAGTFASGRPEVNASHLAGSAVSTTAAQIGVNVVTAGGTTWATVLTNLVSSIWSATTRVLTAGTNIVLAKGTGVTGLTDLDAAGVRTAVGLTSANLDDQLGDLASAADLATVQGDITTLLGRLIALAVATGAVTSGTASATAFPTDLTETADGHWNDAFLVLTSGDLAGQVKRITGYDGTGKVVTVAGGFTGTPAEGDTFALVNR